MPIRRASTLLALALVVAACGGSTPTAVPNGSPIDLPVTPPASQPRSSTATSVIPWFFAR